MPALLDVAIGTVFVFLLFSLVITALNEYILSLADQRAMFLRAGLAEMFAGRAATAGKGLWGHFFLGRVQLDERGESLLSHGLLNALSRSGPDGNSPSYIPAGAFVTGLLDIIVRAERPSAPGHTKELIEAGIKALPTNSKLRESLGSLFHSVDGDIERFKLAVEGWFNAAMDRVSGWYKRLAQKWMIGLGFVAALILNIDTIEIVRQLSNNPNLAASVASRAATYAGSQQTPLNTQDAETERNRRLEAVTQKAENLKSKRAAEPRNQGDIAAAEAEYEKAIADADSFRALRSSVTKLQEAGLPIGWTAQKWNALFPPRPSAPEGSKACPSDDCGQWVWWLMTCVGSIFQRIIGCFITAIAASLGAPFWFDLLNRVVSLRASGRKPEETQDGLPANNLTTTPGPLQPAAGTPRKP